MLNVAIRADGGPLVGMGHIMRCLSVADELRERGCRVYFISKYLQGIEKVRATSFEAFDIRLGAKLMDNISIKCSVKNYVAPDDTGFNNGTIGDLDEDISITKSITAQQGCDLLLVDKYNLTEEYFIEIKKFINKVAYFDDLNTIKTVADIIINGNINAGFLEYTKEFPNQEFLLGTKYTPLRKEFRNRTKKEIRTFSKSTRHNDDIIKRHIKKDSVIPEVMITTGGSDPFNCTGNILDLLFQNHKIAKYTYNIVATSGFKYIDQLKDVAGKNANIKLFIDYSEISEIMSRSDIAISSGGSTLYELCCCGTPTVAFILADNQKEIVKTLSDKQYIQSIGWYKEIDKDVLASCILKLINDYSLRKKISLKMQDIVDGKGAARIAEKIINMLK